MHEVDTVIVRHSCKAPVKNTSLCHNALICGRFYFRNGSVIVTESEFALLFKRRALGKTHQTARREHCLKSLGGFQPLEMSYFVVEQVNTHIPHKDLPLRRATCIYIIYTKVEHERGVINGLTSGCTKAEREPLNSQGDIPKATQLTSVKKRPWLFLCFDNVSFYVLYYLTAGEINQHVHFKQS